MPNNGKYWFATTNIKNKNIMTLAIFDFLISDNIIAKNIANIIKINALFINGFCIKKMMTAKTANKSETPTLFLTFVPLSEPGLPTILSTDTIKRIPLTANNILFTDVNSTEKDIFLKKLEYESISRLYLPNMKLIPRSNALIIINPTMGIINSLNPLNLNISNDNKTHTIKNTEG